MGQVTRIGREVRPPESQTEQKTPGLPSEPFYGHTVDSFRAETAGAAEAGHGQRTAVAALYGESPELSPEQGAEIDRELSTLSMAINELKDRVPADQLKQSAARLAEAMTIRWAQHLAAKFTNQTHKSETTS